ncbi:hypothetical protein WJX73_005477 [Symbiochloris irregularis]|uniref:Uncharacterized protein n=1 Tax=Symbiochloris irregularis TaxID=706552 RepID=A0AAW1NP74_9CHLO
MTISDKIKAALHGGSKEKTGSGSQTGSAGHTSERVTPTGAEAGETGPRAYQPMTSGVTDGQGSGTGSGTGKTASGTGASNTGTGQRTDGAFNSSSGNVSSGNVSSGNVSSGHGHGHTAGTTSPAGGVSSGGDGQFKQGYKEGEPGYSSTYKQGDDLYRDSSMTGGERQSFTASADNKEWAQARELTLAAEREAASAQVAGNKANKELLAAEKAEKALREAQIKHREALQEAESLRTTMAEANVKEQDLNDANELYRARLAAAQQAEQEMKRREIELSDRQRALQEHGQKVDRYGQALPGLEDELAQRHRDREAAEARTRDLANAANQTESNRGSLQSELQRLLAEQEQSESLAAQKQQEYIELRNRAQSAAARVDEYKNKLRLLDEEVMGQRQAAQAAQQDLPALKEAEARAQAELEESQAEWYRLKELEDEYGRNYTNAHNSFKDAKNRNAPASKEVQASQSLLKAREDDLANARSRASKAEGKYRELLSLADRHKKYGDSAAEAAQTHGQKYEALKREAAMHGDKHVEYWNAARSHGDHGSSEATDVIHKLEEKVKNLSHGNVRNEP